MLLTNKIIFPASQAAMNSASVDDNAMVGWRFVLYAMVHPASLTVMPVIDRRVFVQVAQSEST
jgi:hypothetical protein